jgi:hypothetical protein
MYLSESCDGSRKAQTTTYRYVNGALFSLCQRSLWSPWKPRGCSGKPKGEELVFNGKGLLLASKHWDFNCHLDSGIPHLSDPLQKSGGEI